MPYSRRTDTPEPWRGAHMLATALTLLILFAAGLAIAEAADAWTGTLTDHRYATLEQQVADGRAAYVIVATQGNNVLGWELGAFVTNELWVHPKGAPPETWLELGEISEGCCERRFFYAEQHAVGGPFYMHIEAAPIPLNQNELYGIEQCADGSGDWCMMFNGVEVHRFGGWPRIYDSREYGVEVAAEAQPGAWGGAEGREGDGSSWPGPLVTFHDDPGVEAYSYYNIALGWTMGTGAHDEREARHSRPRSRRRRITTVPERRGSHVRGHRREVVNADGSIDVWVTPRAKPERAPVRVPRLLERIGLPSW